MKKQNITSEKKLKEKANQLPLVISYLTIRRAIGILGILFPLVLVFGTIVFGGTENIKSSISSYYHTNMRDFFVGLPCAVALFLFSYKGYEKKDDIAANLGALFSLGVAFLPTSTDDLIPGRNPIIGRLHLISAALFFIVLTYFCLFLFTKTDKRELTRRKQKRNMLYKICGYTMLGCIFLIAVYLLILEDKYSKLKDYDPIFWLESLSLWA